ncbi:hypothetical protein [Ponticaulis sp.]|uniref:hypothetical protein n=1 Tax=Ponticaulis sp. TaxID=2020902 RepID=UPI000B703A4B|nr:hypothetical protein [Ponticaulis sp.]MAI89145.1 hypothetical protein [Ponticaulis sp.]OUY01144.1 MAG: hypothetical protein CBB65_01505 [Hyphomonadaceae bacterium TMED5]|tara:strand:+ start:123478 stop:123729 length:252 start_codon:yes stop_codon:yes gene_type:complete
MTLLRHIGLALILSFGLSVLFYLGLGAFNATGFWLASLGCAFLGVVFGLVFFRKLAMTGIATVLVRVMVFIIMTIGNGPPPVS